MTDKRQKTCQVLVRFTPEEYEQLQALAAELGQSAPEVLRSTWPLAACGQPTPRISATDDYPTRSLEVN